MHLGGESTRKHKPTRTRIRPACACVALHTHTHVLLSACACALVQVFGRCTQDGCVLKRLCPNPTPLLPSFPFSAPADSSGDRNAAVSCSMLSLRAITCDLLHSHGAMPSITSRACCLLITPFTHSSHTILCPRHTSASLCQLSPC